MALDAGVLVDAIGKSVGHLFGSGGLLDQMTFTKQEREARDLAQAQARANQTLADAQLRAAEAALLAASLGGSVAGQEAANTAPFGKYALMAIVGILLLIVVVLVIRWILK